MTGNGCPVLFLFSQFLWPRARSTGYGDGYFSEVSVQTIARKWMLFATKQVKATLAFRFVNFDNRDGGLS